MAGKLIIFSAPSGSGKSTIINYLLQQSLRLRFSISATSRAPRGTEKNGVEYYFLTPEAFKARIAKGDFLEYEEVYTDKFYGTLKSEVYERMEKGQNVLLDIDPQGARMVMEQEPECVSVFILPPSYKALRVRLHTRNTDDPVEIERRLGNAKGEIDQMQKNQYVVVNDELELAYAQLSAIAMAEKQRTNRYFPVIEAE